MRHVPCNLCGADDFSVVIPQDPARKIHRIVRCKRCRLMYANPQELVDCDTFMDTNAHLTFDPEGADKRYFVKQHVQMADYERVVQVLSGLTSSRGRLLEVGSYLGLLSDRLRKSGWDVTGMEPSRPMAEYARSHYGLSIIEGLLPRPELAEGTFDAVVMLHVIEHMPDPGDSLKELRRLLRPGGLLVVETPRFDSLMFKLLGQRERSINNCPGHIYFFTVPTLRQVLEKAGFEVVRTDLVGRTLTVDRVLLNIGVVSRSKPVLRALLRTGEALKLDRWRVHLNLRDMQRIYCRAI